MDRSERRLCGGLPGWAAAIGEFEGIGACGVHGPPVSYLWRQLPWRAKLFRPITSQAADFVVKGPRYLRLLS